MSRQDNVASLVFLSSPTLGTERTIQICSTCTPYSASALLHPNASEQSHPTVPVHYPTLRSLSAATHSWKCNCGQSEKFKHLLLFFYSYFSIMPFSDGQQHFLLPLKTLFLPRTRPNVKTILFWVARNYFLYDWWLARSVLLDGHLGRIRWSTL